MIDSGATAISSRGTHLTLVKFLPPSPPTNKAQQEVFPGGILSPMCPLTTDTSLQTICLPGSLLFLEEEGSAVDLIYLVLDSVNHRLLLDELRGYDIARTVSWVECLLSRRTFKVTVNGTLSQTAESISGVPQGPVIGPILFLIYVNDVPDHLPADSLLCADDVKLIAPRNRHDILQTSLNSSASWSKDWELDMLYL